MTSTPLLQTRFKQLKTLRALAIGLAIGFAAPAFADNLPKWTALMQSGAKTADQIIAIVSTKHVLSEAQKAAIRAAAQPKQETRPEVIDAPAQAKADDDGWLQDYEAAEAQK